MQSPQNGAIDVGGAFDVYAQAYASGVTNADASSAGTGVSCWIGYSTTDATIEADFATGWTWVQASYNTDVGNNDEFVADIGASITSPNTYYYVSRWQLNSGTYVYGGYNGGAWDGTGNVSGVLTVNNIAFDFYNLQSPASGSVNQGDAYDVYAQAYEPGVTNADANSAGTGVSCWIGYSATDATTTADFATGWTLSLIHI